jgi:hypothetical protein
MGYERSTAPTISLEEGCVRSLRSEVMGKSCFYCTLFSVFVAALLVPLKTQASADSDKGFIPEDLFSGLKYRSIGPSRGGRVTAVAGHARQPSIFYMGATGGGVWKTSDYGVTWRPISDGYFATGSIGAIRVAESNESVVYVGTGSDGRLQVD